MTHFVSHMLQTISCAQLHLKDKLRQTDFFAMVLSLGDMITTFQKHAASHRDVPIESTRHTPESSGKLGPHELLS